MKTLRLEQLLIPIPCPDCGRDIEKPLEWIKRNSKHWCEGCHVEIDLDSPAFRNGIRKIEKAMAELERAVLELEITAKYGDDGD